MRVTSSTVPGRAERARVSVNTGSGATGRGGDGDVWREPGTLHCYQEHPKEALMSVSTTTPVTITVDVAGLPAPQGSKQAFVRGTRAVLVEMSRKVKPWREQIALAAQAEATRAGFVPATTALHVEIELRMPRPKRAPKSRVLPVVKPDLDKLVRAVLDGCTGPLWHDDSLVVELVARKVYATEPDLVGATITVTVL